MVWEVWGEKGGPFYKSCCMLAPFVSGERVIWCISSADIVNDMYFSKSFFLQNHRFTLVPKHWAAATSWVTRCIWICVLTFFRVDYQGRARRSHRLRVLVARLPFKRTTRCCFSRVEALSVRPHRKGIVRACLCNFAVFCFLRHVYCVSCNNWHMCIFWQ